MSESGNALRTPQRGVAGDLHARRSCLIVALILLLGAWAAFNWFRLGQTVLRDYVPLPHWDYWRVVTDYQDLKLLHFGVLWKQHNDHRILFPELVFATDMFAFRGLNILPLCASFLCYLATWGVISWTMFTDATLSFAVRSVGSLLAGILMGWRGAATVLGMPFLLQWTLLVFSMLLALACISRVKAEGDWRYLAASVVFAVIANYSAANGLLAWPILVGAALVLRLSRRQIVILAVSAAISIGLFFIGYQSSRPDLLNLVRHPIYALAFLSSYLSVPFGDIGQPYVGICFGLAGVLLFALLLVIAVTRTLLSSTPVLVLSGAYLFAVLSALMVASARMNPNDPLYIAAKAARYATLPLTAWAALICAGLWTACRLRSKLAMYLMVSMTILVYIVGFKKTEIWATYRDIEFAEQQVAALSVESGLFDPDLVRKLYPDPHLVELYLPQLKKDRLSIYSFAFTKWLSEDAANRFEHPRGPLEAGDITQVYPVRGGLEVMGWAEGVRRHTYFPKVVFVSDQGRIIGFGQRLTAGYPINIASPRTPVSIAWLGFLQTPPGAKSFSAYVINRRTSSLGQIGGTTIFPDIKIVGAENVGVEIPIQWNTEGAWKRDLIPIRPNQPQAPIEYLSSWSGSDANSGSAKSNPMPLPANRCVVLPVLHGPSVAGISARILDGNGREEIVNIPMQGASTGWNFWEVRTQSSADRFAIEAVDQGTGWGQWIAVAAPRECK